jgi:ligand-binding SRPBCC domain-containing protein
MTISFRPVPLLPLRMQWDAYITGFRWNDFFCDEQRRGPFRYFRHCHRIREELREGVSGTVISDAVEYELPLGFLGDVANALGMKLQLASLFRHRQKTLLKLLKTQIVPPSEE